MSTSQGGSSGSGSGSGSGRGGAGGGAGARGQGRGQSSNGKGKGRAAGGNSRNPNANPNPNHRVRRAADYTPVQQPLADPARIAEATRLAVEREQERQEREREDRAAAAAATASSEVVDAGREVAAITGGGSAAGATMLDPSAGLQAPQAVQDGEENVNGAQDDEEDEEEEEFCYICAEPVRYWVLGTCNHRTCHVCSLRLRALYKKRECTFCKVGPRTSAHSHSRHARADHPSSSPARPADGALHDRCKEHIPELPTRCLSFLRCQARDSLPIARNDGGYALIAPLQLSGVTLRLSRDRLARPEKARPASA